MTEPRRGASCVLALLAACSSASPDPDAIAAALPPARELDPEQRSAVDAQVAAALGALGRFDWDAARSAADRALAADPREARALAIRAITRQRRAAAESPPILSLLRRAEGELRLASGLAPDDPVVARLHARFLAHEGHLTAAAERAEQGLAAAPDDLDLLELAGLARYELGDERLADAHFERLLAQRPADSEILFRFGESQLRIAVTAGSDERLAHLERAAGAFAAYRELRPDDPDGYLGEAQARARLLAEAPERAAPDGILELLARAAAIVPESPRPHFDRGVVLEALGRADEARDAYAAALERAPAHVPSLLNLAASQAEAGMVEAAQATCLRALERATELSRDERQRLQEFVERSAPAATPR